MPATPVTWLNQFIANITTAGNQIASRITQLANGNLLVVWNSDNDTGVGSDPGFDVIGQIFTPLGDLVGAEFRVNGGFFVDDEQAADVAGLPGGGFLTVFEDNDYATVNFSIRLTERDADGSNPVAIDIFDDTSDNAGPSYFGPRVAVSSDTSALVVAVLTEVGGGGRIVGKIYDATTDAVGAEISVFDAGTNRNVDLAVLANGDYVVTCVDASGGDNTIAYRILDATGGNVLGATVLSATLGGSEFLFDTTVTALTGGGFVVGWTSFTPVNFIPSAQFQRFDAAGVAQGGIVTIQNNGSADQKSMGDLVALSDGGFIVLYAEGDSTFDEGLRGRRFDAAGVQVGVDFLIQDGSVSRISAVVLGDGRVAISYGAENGEIGVEIIDPRDTANDPGVYTGTQWQIGTVGDDVFTADEVSEFVIGHDGNDTITAAGQTRSYDLGAGDDRMIVASVINTDIYIGGTGTDTIDWSASFETGAVFDLEDGTATTGFATEAMTGFENLIGTTNRDNIFGSSVANTLSGGDGNDVIAGNGGTDSVDAGAGNDIVLVDDAETTTGGSGVDRLDLQAFAIDIGFDLASGSSNAAGRHTLYENVTMGSGNDAVTGSSADNVIDGRGGNDELRGQGGNDSVLGGTGNDRLFGDAGNDTLNGGSGTDTVDGGAGNDTIRITGFDLPDIVIGGLDTDTLDMSDYGSDIFVNAPLGQYGVEIASPISQTLTGIERIIGSAQSDSFFAATMRSPFRAARALTR